MQQFIQKFADRILGILSGFDRLVLRGTVRRLNYSFHDASRNITVARGMEEYLWQNQILVKDYGDHVRKVGQRIKERSLKPFRDAGLPIIIFA